MRKKEKRQKNALQYMQCVLPGVFILLTLAVFVKYRMFLTQYESKLIERQNEMLETSYPPKPVGEIYADVVSKYSNLIKNSTRWVYTSLESYRQFKDNLLVQEQDSIQIYPNWNGCKKGYFKLPKMDDCHPWLDCDGVKRVKLGERLKFGLGKEVFDADWNGHTVAYVRLRPERLHQGPIRNRVRTGIQNLIQLQPSPYVTQVLGFCFEGHNSIMISELAPYGDLKDFVNSQYYSDLNPLGRLGIAIRLTRVFAFMHHSPIGTRINCDMTKVTRALSQFLVTADYRIVANDLDDLPEVTKGNLPNCTWGKIEDRDPMFQSPEERLYQPDRPLPFTEKADVWKMVNMTRFIMYKYANGAKEKEIDELLEPLAKFMAKCQSYEPASRPDSVVLVQKLIERYRKAANFL